MWINRANLYASVVRSTPEERAWLRDFLSFEDGSSRFRQRYRRPGDDGRIRLYNAAADTFPTGLLPLVKQAADIAKFSVEIVERRAQPCMPTAVDLSWLRDYQLEAVQRVVRNTRGILHIPTGGGKTEIAIGLTMLLPCRWLFLVNSKDLLEQTAARYEDRTGQPAGRVGDGTWIEERFTVATFQTLSRALAPSLDGQAKLLRARDLLGRAAGLIIDEVHVLPADTFTRVAMKTPAAYYRVGMSGTPLARGDNKSIGIIAAIGPKIYRLRADALVEAGVLAKPKIRLVPLEQHSPHEEWSDVYRELVVRSPVRNQLLVDCAKRAAKPCLLFVKEVAHGKALAKMLGKLGVRVEFVWGDAATEVRQAAVKRLVRGDVDVLVCSVIFQTGVDIPSLASLVVGAGGKSIIAALQRIGRGMRTDGGKKASFEVWDVSDRGNPMLEKHARARVKAYTSEGHETIIEPAKQAALSMV